MKKILLILLFIVSSFQANATSSSALSAALTTVAVTGTVVSVSQLQYQRWLQGELKDWQASDTKVTTSLGESCGIPFELRVLGNRRNNVFYFAISNKTDSDITLKTQRIEINYSSGRRRFAKFPFRQNDIAVKQGWWASGILPAPTKKDFQNVDSITISIPYFTSHGEEETCKIQGTLKRNLEVEPLKSSYNRTHYLDMLLGFGVTHSDSKALSNPAFSFLMQFGLYFGNGHGFTFGVNTADTDSKTSKTIQAIRGLPTDNLVSTNFQLGYMIESEFKDRHYVYWGLGATQNNLSYNLDGRSHDLVSNWGTFSQITYDYNFARVDYGQWKGDYFIGLLLQASLSKIEKIGGIEIGGLNKMLLATFRLSI